MSEKSPHVRRRLPLERNELPAQLRRAESGNAIASVWRGIRDTIYSGGSQVPYKKLPPFAARLGKMFWDCSEDDVLDAILRGDPAWFVAWMIRLDQIDVAMIESGSSLADRAPIIQCRYTLDGFREAAETRLKKFGGSWPPKAA
jgi:hypothetical protein